MLDTDINVASGDVQEKKYGELHPSLMLALPSTVLGVIATLLISYYILPIVFASPVGDFAPKSAIWLAVFVMCMASPLWKMLVLATTEYEITSQRLIYKVGVFNRKQDQLEIVRIRDLSTYRPFFQRLVGLGSLHLETVDRTHPTLVIPGQNGVDELKHFLHRMNTAERERLGYREFENTM